MEPGLAGILRSVYGGLSIGPRPDGEYMDLVIVESGAKSKTIQKYLGKGWIVEACNGHVRDLPTSRDTKHGKKAMWASTADKLPSPPWEWTENSERTIGKILTKAKDSKVENIYIATDPDREGEGIGYHVQQVLLESGISEKKIKRSTFHEVTEVAVKQSMEDAGEINMPMVDAFIARRILDRIAGFIVSKKLNSFLRLAPLSAGRVQSPTLNLVTDREDEINAFIPEEFWNINAEFSSDSKKYTSQLFKLPNKLSKDFNIKNADEAKNASDLVRNARGTVDSSRESLLEAVSMTIETNERTLEALQTTNTRVVEAMAAITQSSQKISGIITLINDIAFQTNLLALNASVEAARAGEHGKGFAVVATEVRKLAHRSAKASSEIGNLVESSLQNINSGKDFVEKSDEALSSMRKETEEILQDLKDQSNENLETILKTVIEFSEMMDNIEAASQEHASGINQVNQAISEMDLMTQENASMVEQNATASHNMAVEAKRLRKMFISNRGRSLNISEAYNQNLIQSIEGRTFSSSKSLPLHSEKDYRLKNKSTFRTTRDINANDDFK